MKIINFTKINPEKLMLLKLCFNWNHSLILFDLTNIITLILKEILSYFCKETFSTSRKTEIIFKWNLFNRCGTPKLDKGKVERRFYLPSYLSLLHIHGRVRIQGQSGLQR
jgi:hypothetical protein